TQMMIGGVPPGPWICPTMTSWRPLVMPVPSQVRVVVRTCRLPSSKAQDAFVVPPAISRSSHRVAPDPEVVVPLTGAVYSTTGTDSTEATRKYSLLKCRRSGG